MKTLLLILGIAFGWQHPAALILMAVAEYAAAGLLIWTLIRRLNRDRHGHTRPHAGTAG